MGVITLALVANGTIASDDFHVPDWVVISSATAISLGTYVGGWRIIKTMGSRIHKMDSAQGFAAQGAGATVILAASHVGFPLSTTHTISGAVIGSGAAKRLSAVRWGVAGNIVVAWILTLPMAALFGGLTYLITRVFGTGALGPIVVSTAIVVAAVLCSRGARSRARPRCEPERRRRDRVDRRHWDALLQVIWVSLIAGVGVPSCYALAILGGTRAVEFGRTAGPWRPSSSCIVGALGLGVVFASIVFGDLTLVNDSGASRSRSSSSPVFHAPTDARTRGPGYAADDDALGGQPSR